MSLRNYPVQNRVERGRLPTCVWVPPRTPYFLVSKGERIREMEGWTHWRCSTGPKEDDSKIEPLTELYFLYASNCKDIGMQVVK